jgi:hypothetical protein
MDGQGDRPVHHLRAPCVFRRSALLILRLPEAVFRHPSVTHRAEIGILIAPVPQQRPHSDTQQDEDDGRCDRFGDTEASHVPDRVHRMPLSS